jgi:nitrogen fixation protein NifQ
MGTPEYNALMGAARYPGDVITLAFGGVLSRSAIRGLDTEELGRLRDRYFPAAGTELARCFEKPGDGECPAFRVDEFTDIVQLLLDHRRDDSDGTRWLAHAIASACLDNNHLWQDMGLPNRDALSELLRRYFGTLYRKNTGNMKWKRFFYKQLCDQAEVSMCKVPSCKVCTDYAVCFGPEDGPPVTGC